MTSPRTAPSRGPGSGPSREEAQALAGLTALLVITAAWWALALWPVAGGAPEWLARTRAVCFGVAGDGLPDAGGWIGLIGGPAGMLAILLVGWSRGVRGLLRRARRSAPTAAALTALVLSGALLLGGAGWRVQEARGAGLPGSAAAAALASDGAVPATYPRLDRPAPLHALRAHTGETLDLTELAGRPVLVTFAYAHCATVCPLLVRNALRARETMEAAGAAPAAVPAVVVLTLDPWRDTPSRLPAMARDWGFPADGAWLLGGPVAEVEAALDAWGVPRSRDLTTGEVTHPALTYILDADGRIAYATTGAAETLVSLLRRL